ncbi:MAG: hypothetical protein HPM95_02400 [Alphaproteobacteria bacterium]|nr:hypothetical protein [Alphaproteobacteria bacterium]
MRCFLSIALSLSDMALKTAIGQLESLAQDLAVSQRVWRRACCRRDRDPALRQGRRRGVADLFSASAMRREAVRRSA